jgi:flagellin
MPITLGSNIASLRAQRSLGKSTLALSDVYQKLSSGQRINKASDDAAGLSIADSLKAQQRVATVAVRNANDGISSIAIADAALAEIGNTLSRMAELSEQSANGVFSIQQRSALGGEFIALASEIERIAVTTNFNGVTLLSGNTTMTLQVGLAALGLAAINSSSLAFSLNGATVEAGQSASRATLDAVNAAISSLAQTRGTLGAAESRLSVAITNLTVARENFAGAESQIRDTDVAQQAAELTRLNILQQAGSAVLAQANQQPSLALSLLR